MASLGGCAGAQGIRTGFESLDRFRAGARGSIEDGAGDETRTRDINLGKGEEIICRVAKSGNRRPTTSRQPSISTSAISGSEFINPHRLFHGVWLPQWLEERPELSEKAKKLYAIPDLLRGRQGLRLAFVQSSRGKTPYLAPLSDQARAGAFRSRSHRSHQRHCPNKGPLHELLPILVASLDADRSRPGLLHGCSRRTVARPDRRIHRAA